MAGGEVLKAAGYTATGVNLALGATGALTVANSAYKKVYEDTNGDTKKAYNAAMLSAPIGFVGSIAELSAVSGEISPMFTSMSKYDQARYVAQAFTKRGTAGAATIAGMDIAQQGAEISQTGKPLDLTRTAEAAVGGWIGIGTIGAFTGYFGGRAAFLQNKNAVEADLIKFRNSIDQTVALPTKVVPKDIAENFGLTATVQPDGTTLITKNTSAPVAGTMPELLKTLDSRYTPDEILALGQRQGTLASKRIRTQTLIS